MSPRYKKTNKSVVLSVSLGTGCYRHIQISFDETLFELADTVLWAFNFDNDHAHAFFMNNKVWDDSEAYFMPDMNDNGKPSTDKVRLSELSLTKGKQFTFVFDFGDEWCFKCKVLRIVDEETKEPFIVEVKGKAPEQYPDYDDDYEEIPEMPFVEVEPELYAAAFAFSSVKPWKKMNDEDVFALKLSNDEVVYCTVMGKAGEYHGIGVYFGQSGWNFLEELLNGGREAGDSGNFDSIISLNAVHCEFINKSELTEEEADSVTKYSKENGISLKGKNTCPHFVKFTPYHIPWSVTEKSDREIIGEALKAGKYVYDNYNDFELGRSCDKIPLIISENDSFRYEYIPRPEIIEPEYDSPEIETDKLPKKYVWECEMFVLPTSVGGEAEKPPVFPFILMCGCEEIEYILKTTPFEEYVPDDVIRDFADKFNELGYCPEKILVSDKRTYAMLKNYCNAMDIELTETDSLSLIEQAKYELLEHFAGESEDFDMDDMINNVVQLMSDEMLELFDAETLEMIAAEANIPEEIKEKARKLLEEK